ncbi:hypothetical protein [uncultured Sulfitobacter sp.]|uniref:hypothetical protein n=1 Tax=uncultured Sulfitobacter sp. TaxID=191468 RepID=UPI00261688DA|nr:hypothetical protein [uncultured Sulfitobacter sp.]
MNQIITGPFGRLAYFGADEGASGQYPALNAPSVAFAQGHDLIGANMIYAPNVVSLPRQMRTRAAEAMFGVPAKRES